MRRRGVVAAWVLGWAVLAGLPLVVQNSFLLHVCILVFMWTVLGEAWNALGGYAGQVSFGHAAFFGLGSYVTIILFLRSGIAPWWGIPMGGLAAAAASVPIGLVAFRLRGPYFSLATLAVAELAKLVALNWEWATNGSTGYLITTLPPLHVLGVTVNWESKAPFYWVAFALMAISMAAVALLARSRLGAFLVAIRENEEAAEAVGIDTVRAKVLTLALSAFLAGMGGGFYAFYFRYVDPDAVLNLGNLHGDGLHRHGGRPGHGGRPVHRRRVPDHRGRGGARALPGGTPHLLRALHDAGDPLPARRDLGAAAEAGHAGHRRGGAPWRSWRLRA